MKFMARAVGNLELITILDDETTHSNAELRIALVDHRSRRNSGVILASAVRYVAVFTLYLPVFCFLITEL